MSSGEQRPRSEAGEARAAAGSWLGGVRSAGVDLGYPGERLGLPEEGTGSAASYGRRLGALLIDWFIALAAVNFVAAAFHLHPGRGSLWPVLAFGAETWILVSLLGLTIGKRLFGLRVVRLDGRPVGPLWAFVRTLLLCAVVPALLWDRDHRGLHDRASNTVVLRA